MNITALLAIIFYVAIIIVPFVIVVGATLKELSRIETTPEGENKSTKKKNKK